MLAPNIETEVRGILRKKGKGGWLRVSQCAKLYARGNASKETKFYRWRKQVEKGKVEGFQVLPLPGNISFIGLESADPRTMKSFISEDKKLSRALSIETALFWKKQAFEDFIKIRNAVVNKDPDDLVQAPEATLRCIETYPFLNDNLKAEKANLKSLIERSIPTRPTDFLSMVEQRYSLIRIAKGDVPKILEKVFRLLHEN